MSVRIHAATAPKIGFVSHQNAVPILRELELVNETTEAIEGIRVSIEADPPILEPKHWLVERIEAESTLHIQDLDVRIQGGYLGGLTESLLGDLRIEVMRGDERISVEHRRIEILSRSDWGGIGAMAELLPAFVMPNDPAVDTLLKATSDVLRRAGKPDGINGYESGSRSRVWQLASAMWSAVAAERISYALPPASFEEQGQKIRTPSMLLDRKVGTCLDTALLFAATLEQANLNPLIVITRGHAFVGVWLQPQEFSSLLTDDASTVRKRIDLNELLVFETTLVTTYPSPTFTEAIENARRQIAEENEEKFVVAIDVHRARMQRIRPLSIDTPLAGIAGTRKAAPSAESLEEAPMLPEFDVEIPESVSAPADRILVWQRKLLDLTTRNRLLHLPPNSKVVRLVCPDPARLEDLLADGKKISVRPVPELEVAGRDAALYERQTNDRLLEDYANAALEKNEVLSPLDAKKLDAALVDLYRKAKSDLEEGGANTLFLALGFLKWKKSADDPKQYRAPLILLPIKLERKSALSGVKLAAHEDEPRFNLTLLELLRQDFELRVPGLDGELPTDDSGIDVRGIWNRIRREVRDLAGFEVVEEVVIGTFSFAKYLMWKDLVDRADQIKQSPVVKHLIERGAERFEDGSIFPKASELDQKVDPASLFAPLPADSSQIAAIVGSGNGCSFVLDGPPGTGKSQTIANMIAHNLGLGRRVLFVAEKRAALEVVYRRLEEVGLGAFCLELHSNKTSKLDVLKQLERAWDTRDSLSADEWRAEASTIRTLRDRLNRVIGVLHETHPNGLTIHSAIGRVVRDATESTPRLNWPNDTVHDASALAHMRDVARRLGITSAAIHDLPSEFSAIERDHWTNSWQDELVAAAANLPARISALIQARDRLIEATGATADAADYAAICRLADLTIPILKTHGRNFGFAFTAGFQSIADAAREAVRLISEYRQAESELSCTYAPEAARTLNVSQYEDDFARANDRFWFLAGLARKRVARNLAQQCGAADLPNLEADLPRLKRLHEILDALDALSDRCASVPGWSGVTSDLDQITSAVEIAVELRDAITALAQDPSALVRLRQSVRALVVDANELLAQNGVIASAATTFAKEIARFQSAWDRLAHALSDGAVDEAPALEDLEKLCGAILDHSSSLKSWCDWQRVKNEGVKVGLEPIVDAVRLTTPDTDAEAMFEVAYGRWFAAKSIDAEPVLADFISDVHVNDIESYRRLEDRLSEMAVRYVRATLCGRIPDKNSVSKRDGYGILKHQLALQRRHKPVRQLAIEMGDSFSVLAPCMLMSPLSIAQYLPPDQELFDLVILDEASQITPWDAIGSLARGRQVVIAGDPRQMPPTSFFNRAAGATDDDEAAEEDQESILDECLAAGIPQHSLSWHYRSRHESLIAFSNHRYYDNGLVTFPAPVRRESAVSWCRVEGVYAKRTNPIEAQAMVAMAVKLLRDPAFVGAGRTLAIVTLNSDQQRLVEDLLDAQRRRHPEIEPFFAEDIAEPVAVKNLETVQGDERDVILLGIGYGPAEPGGQTMSMNFGPLNRDGGWRRLNVAVTRARHEMVLFTSFDAHMIDLGRTSARAVRDLKHLIEYAERGPRALAETVSGSVGDFESPFEEAIADALRRKGWVVVPQIGVSRFRIDIGVVHPDRPGDYLLGVECDGATYHSAATTRDRDKVRAAILESLGWKLTRVWSTDWWIDRHGAAERLHQTLSAALEASRRNSAPTPDAQVADVARSTGDSDPFVDVEDVDEEIQGARDLVRTPIQTGHRLDPQLLAGSTKLEGHPLVYQMTNFSEYEAVMKPESFYEPSYGSTLVRLVTHVIESEGPISDSLLVERIARAHSFQRSGRIIREMIMRIVDARFYVTNGGGEKQFVWLDEVSRRNWSSFRIPERDEDVRPIDDVAPEELRAAAAACLSDDRPTEIARLFGIRRLSRGARELIERALEG